MITIPRFKAYFHLIHLPPISLAALSIIGGIGWAHAKFFWFFPLLLSLAICLYRYFKNLQYSNQLLICTILSTLAILSYNAQIKEPALTQWLNTSVGLYGKIVDITKINSGRYKSRLTLKLSRLFDDQRSHLIHESIWIYLRYNPNLEVDDTLVLTDIVFKPIKNESFKNYLIKEGINQTLFLNNNNKIKRTGRPYYSLLRFIHQIKNRVLNRLTKKMNPNTGSLFSSIFLGKKLKSKTTERNKEQFKIWGLSHYLARSGLHLVIFIIIWELLLSLLPISFLIKQLLCLFLAFIYALLSWSTTSFIRALGTFFIYKMSIMTNTQIHSMHIIILIGSILLLFNPMLLFFVDFQLSFLFTFALSWIMQSYNDCIRA